MVLFTFRRLSCRYHCEHVSGACLDADVIAGTHHTRWVEEELDLTGMARPTAPALPEDEAVAQREITVEIGGRRYLVTYWMPEQAHHHPSLRL